MPVKIQFLYVGKQNNILPHIYRKEEVSTENDYNVDKIGKVEKQEKTKNKMITLLEI